MENAGTQLDRINPLMLHTILAAVRRFEPDLYTYLCRTYHLDADRILGLFDSVEELGTGQLGNILRDLRTHQAYHDIVYLAGRNSFLLAQERYKLKLKGLGHPAQRFPALAKQLLGHFLGGSELTMLMRGQVHFAEISRNLFVKGATHANPTCGFYAGLLAELGTNLTGGSSTAQETCCMAADPTANCCTFHVVLG